MYSKAKYHLYESAHSGLLPDKPVNLLPKTWTTRTITDGFWMTDNTLSALNWRDYFLANMIDTVDEDKRNHYIAGNGIAINHEERTISFVPNESNYEFDENSGMFFVPQTEYVYTKLPNEVEGLENKIKIIDGCLNYDLTSADKDIDEEPSVDTIPSAGAAGLTPESITEFPTGINFVFVSKQEFVIDDSSAFSSYKDRDYWIEKDSGCAWNWETSSKDYWTSSYEEPSARIIPSSLVNSNCFDPSSTATYNGGYEGGSNYITDTVNMVPSGVLFIF